MFVDIYMDHVHWGPKGRKAEAGIRRHSILESSVNSGRPIVDGKRCRNRYSASQRPQRATPVVTKADKPPLRKFFLGGLLSRGVALRVEIEIAESGHLRPLAWNCLEQWLVSLDAVLILQSWWKNCRPRKVVSSRPHHLWRIALVVKLDLFGSIVFSYISLVRLHMLPSESISREAKFGRLHVAGRNSSTCCAGRRSIPSHCLELPGIPFREHIET